MYSRIASISVSLSLAIAWVAAWPGPVSAQNATNLNCSGCVGSGDLANGAATRSKVRNFAIDASKLAGSAVISAKLATGAVTRGKIRDFAVNGSKLAGSAVSTAKIANSAVTGAKIANSAVSAAKIATGAVGTEKIGNGAVTFAKLADDAVFTRTRIVSPVGDGSDTAANGMELLDALTDVAAANPAPGVDNPWLIKIEPGIYDVGTTAVMMLPYVDIEGSGQGVTHIEGAAGSPNSNALVNLASNSALRHLTVNNDGSQLLHHGVGVGAGLNNTENWRISDVTALGANGTNFSAGLFFFPTGCDGGVMANITATGSGPGGNRGIAMNCNAGTVTGTNITASSSGGTASIGLLKNNGSTFRVRDSAFSGGTNSLDVNSGTVKVISSEIDGTVANSATLKCVGAYDANGDPLGAGCT